MLKVPSSRGRVQLKFFRKQLKSWASLPSFFQSQKHPEEEFVSYCIKIPLNQTSCTKFLVRGIFPLGSNWQGVKYCISTLTVSNNYPVFRILICKVHHPQQVFAITFSRGTGGLSSPGSGCHSRSTFPFSTASRMWGYMFIAVLEWKSPPALNAANMLLQLARCARILSSNYCKKIVNIVQTIQEY